MKEDVHHDDHEVDVGVHHGVDVHGGLWSYWKVLFNFLQNTLNYFFTIFKHIQNNENKLFLIKNIVFKFL